MTFRSEGFVYDENFIRGLCRDIVVEKDPEKTQALMDLLRAAMHEDREEVRTRIQFLSKKYAHVLAPESAATE
jgi:hypothetical protein